MSSMADEHLPQGGVRKAGTHFAASVNCWDISVQTNWDKFRSH